MNEIKRHKRTVIVCAAVVALVFILISWQQYDYQSAAKRNLVQYVGDLRVSYKPPDLVYEQKGNNYLLSTKTLANTPQCKPGDNPIGTITRIDKTKLPGDLTAAQMQQAVAAGKAKDMGTYWLVYAGPQAACSDNLTIQQQQLSGTKQAQAVFKSAQ